MAKTGIRPKFKISTLKQQRENAELEHIIEEFGRAMRNANRAYIATPQQCLHDTQPRFTPGMHAIWSHYIVFCMEHPE